MAVGELVVADNLPEPLAQGLFAGPRTYPVIVRLANVPGEVIPDAVNTQRGFSFKVLNVEGPKLAGHQRQLMQYFVPDSGTTSFPNPDMDSFLMQHRMIEHRPQVPDMAKEVMSAVVRVTISLGGVPV